jgi:polysaccharide pyruvyl transferase WcaK-like protein
MLPLSQATGAEFVAPLCWQDVVMEFKQSALVVTNRLHCMIFTFFADVPLLPLLNREKVVGVRQDAKLTHAIQDVTELTAEKIDGCLQDRQRTLDEIRSYRQSAIAAHPSPLPVSKPVPAP